MQFEIIPTKKVIDYLKKYGDKSGDKRHRDMIETAEVFDAKLSVIKDFFAFQNEYGEKYLCAVYFGGEYWLGGDESDWEECNLIPETKFVEKVIRKRYVRKN